MCPTELGAVDQMKFTDMHWRGYAWYSYSLRPAKRDYHGEYPLPYLGLRPSQKGWMQ